MRAYCGNCNHEQYVDAEGEDFTMSGARCEICGAVGSLRCGHASIHNGFCDDCFKEICEDFDDLDDLDLE